MVVLRTVHGNSSDRAIGTWLKRGTAGIEQDSPKQHAGSEASFRYPAFRPKAGAKGASSEC